MDVSNIDWTATGIWTLIALLIIKGTWGLVGREAEKAYADLRPDWRYTWFSVGMLVILLTMVLGLWRLGTIESSEAITITAAARLTALLMVGLIWSTVSSYVLINRLGKRVIALERHHASSATAQ